MRSLRRQEAVRLDYRIVSTAMGNLVEIVYLNEYLWKRPVGMYEICSGLRLFLETYDLDCVAACSTTNPSILRLPAAPFVGLLCC